MALDIFRFEEKEVRGTVNTYPKAILDEYYVRGGNLSEN